MKLSTFLASHSWCQGALAGDAAGEPCEPQWPEAVSWSLLGAMILLPLNDYLRAARLLLAELPPIDLYRSPWHQSPIRKWNDQPGRTKEDVIELCRRLDI